MSPRILAKFSKFCKTQPSFLLAQYAQPICYISQTEQNQKKECDTISISISLSDFGQQYRIACFPILLRCERSTSIVGARAACLACSEHFVDGNFHSSFCIIDGLDRKPNWNSVGLFAPLYFPPPAKMAGTVLESCFG